ncbi:uncharacterized protein ppp1r15b [Anableps anableps]
MFRNFYTEGRLSDSQSTSTTSSAPLGVASVGFDSQESSWIGLLSRPALSLLRKVRRWSAAPAEISNSCIGEEREILRQLNEMMPPAAHHLSYTQCQHDGTAGLLEPGPAGSVPWLTAVSVRHVGLRSPGEKELHQQPQLGYFSSVRTLINQVLVNSQEAQAWVSVSPPGRSGSAGEASPWWGSFLRGGHGSEMSEEGTETRWLCRPSAAQTKTPPVLESMLPESSGPPQLVHSGARVQNMERPSPEQDNGYSSLEEELSQRGLLAQQSPPSEQQQEPPLPQLEEAPGERPEPEGALSAPQCRNKSIAFIMGCPCSDDDDSSQSEPESDDDDDGFDSEGSSDLSESESSEDSDSEPDLESERLWTSLCQSVDPYNPRSFTAPLHTAPAPPAHRRPGRLGRLGVGQRDGRGGEPPPAALLRLLLGPLQPPELPGSAQDSRARRASFQNPEQNQHGGPDRSARVQEAGGRGEAGQRLRRGLRTELQEGPVL